MDNMTLEQQFDQEQREMRARYEAARDEENRRIGDERLTRIEAEQEEQREERRKAEAAELESFVERAFFSGNPQASREQWEKLKDRLIEEELVRRARLGSVEAETDALRQRTPGAAAANW
jgi:hypothetical protein